MPHHFVRDAFKPYLRNTVPELSAANSYLRPTSNCDIAPAGLIQANTVYSKFVHDRQQQQRLGELSVAQQAITASDFKLEGSERFFISAGMLSVQTSLLL